MRCEHCGTLVEGSNGTCPLCGSPLPTQNPVFPPRKAKVRRSIVPFTEVFLSVTVVATVVLGIVNAYFKPHIQYWAIGLMGMWYVYVTLRRTILGLENRHYKLLGQTIAILVLLYTVAGVLPSPDVVIWAVPLFFATACLVNAILALSALGRANRYLLCLWSQSLVGGIVVVVCFVLRLYWLPTVICGGFGLAMCLLITCLRPRELWHQIKRTLDR